MTTTTPTIEDQLQFAYQLGIWTTLSEEARAHHRLTGTTTIVFVGYAHFIETDGNDGPEPPVPAPRVTLTYPAEMFDAAMGATS